MTLEAAAREKIDEPLISYGWATQNDKAVYFPASRGIAPTKGHSRRVLLQHFSTVLRQRLTSSLVHSGSVKGSMTSKTSSLSPTAIACALALSVLSLSARADVPALAKLKAAAETGNPQAQYQFAKSFGVGGAEWRQWLNAAAVQDYGPAEDELAWSLNWSNFATNFSDPRMRSAHLKQRGSRMRQALIFASAAADKGFGRSRLLLAMAFAHGYLVPPDRVEAYYWMKLSEPPDLMANISKNHLRDELLKTMPLADVERAEARAAKIRPAATAVRIRNAMILPGLKLTGLFASGDRHVAVVNGTKLVSDQNAELSVDGVSFTVRCLCIDEKSALIELLPDGSQILLRMNLPPRVLE